MIGNNQGQLIEKNEQKREKTRARDLDSVQDLIIPIRNKKDLSFRKET